MKIVVGVDGGGTNTNALAIDVDTGKIIGASSSGPSNYHNIGIDKAIENVKSAVEKLTEENIEILVLGLAGLDTRKDEKNLKEAFYKLEGKLAKRIIVEHDAFITLFAHTLGEKGSIVIAGTGSIALSYDGMRRFKSGDWGYLLGDVGSAYQLGLKGLRAAIAMLDGRLPPSILLREIMKDLNFNEIDEIVEWAYKNPNVSEIASLAKAVDRAASKGDGIAKDIIANSAMELVEACKTVSMRAGVNEVGYTGGVFKSDLFREKFVSFARERGLNALMLRRKPEIGAIAIGLKELNYSIELVDRLMM